MNRDYSQAIVARLDRVAAAIERLSATEIDVLANLLDEVRMAGGNVFIMGNGGSAATASHFAVDLNKNLASGKGPRFRATCLTDNVPVITALSNDMGYEYVFVEQIRDVLRTEDLVMAISGSGDSENVLRAIEYANGIGAMTVGLCGMDGGRLKQTARHSVHVSGDMLLSEDLHLAILHTVFAVLYADSDHA